MQLPEPERREVPDNLIPLINIVFLLLIFFMIAGAMEVIDALDIDVPESGSETELLDSPLTLLLAADGRLAIGEDVFTLDELEMRMVAILTDSESQAGDSAPNMTAEAPIRIKADQAADAELLLGALEALRRAGVPRIVLVTEQP
ncbi:MAG: ExbD/TolR family protein [Thioalkalivibrionaceae bacterium]